MAQVVVCLLASVRPWLQNPSTTTQKKKGGGFLWYVNWFFNKKEKYWCKCMFSCMHINVHMYIYSLALPNKVICKQWYHREDDQILIAGVIILITLTFLTFWWKEQGSLETWLFLELGQRNKLGQLVEP
jgi:hypothetical protein